MYWSRGLFLWMVQRKSRFRNLKRDDGTTQEFVSVTSRVCKFHFCLLAQYFISWNSSGFSHINFGQTVWDTDPLLCLSFFTWAGLEHLMDLCWHTTTLWATCGFSSTSCSCMVKLVSASFKRPRRIWTGVFFMFLDFPLEKRSHNWSRRHRNRNPVGSNSGCPTCFLVKLIGNGLETKNTH